MTFLRNAILLAAMLISYHASAEVHSFSFKGTVTNPGPSLDLSYPIGSAVNGVFHIDDGIPGNDSSGSRTYYGAYSGTATIGGNTISFADSYSSVVNVSNVSADVTYLTMLGGNAWNTGGMISETQSPAGLGIQGFQIMLIYPALIPVETSIASILESPALPPSASFYLSYDMTEFAFIGAWGNITEILPLAQPAAIPEPNVALLFGLGVMALLAARKRRSASGIGMQ